MHKDNQALISDLILIAKADGNISPAEYDFIHQMALKMNVTETELKILIENPLPSVKLQTEMDRIIHYYKMVLTMFVDNNIHDEEVVAVKNFGLKLGIRQGAVDQIIIQMKEKDNYVLGTDQLMKIFKTYYN